MGTIEVQKRLRTLKERGTALVRAYDKITWGEHGVGEFLIKKTRKRNVHDVVREGFMRGCET